MAKVACIGAGLVGRAWAVVFARAGHEVWLYDAIAGEVERTAIPRARETISLLCANDARGEPEDAIAGRLHAASTIPEAVSGAIYVQESVKEDVAVKRAVLAEIDAAASSDCILASSTSAIRGSEFLQAISHPERALVAHPVNPPALIPLVELCATPSTSAVTLDWTRQFMTAAGMAPVIVAREIDGFLLNRLQFALVGEALHLVGEGYCSAADIDTVVTQGLALRWASMGPFEVMHLNSARGVMGFAESLGPMMKHLGANARTGYDWTPQLIGRLHAEMSRRIPVEAIPERQSWRDRRILATRKMQSEE